MSSISFQVPDAIKLMKSSNSAGFDGVTSNMVRHGVSEILSTKMSILLNAIIIYNYIPENFNTSLIVSIEKNNQIKKFNVKNMRPISVSNVIA
jgi:hypothetical protein